MRLWIALRAFLASLMRAETAKQIQQILVAQIEDKRNVEREEKPAAKPTPSRVPRTEALTLLAALQREARFLDFVQESLDDYPDVQIGAAARDVHRDCRKVLMRMFDIRPITDQQEGSSIEVPAGFDANCYHLTGNVTGEPPFHGRLTHHGWEATRCDLPTWSGNSDAARLLAPIEVELP